MRLSVWMPEEMVDAINQDQGYKGASCEEKMSLVLAIKFGVSHGVHGEMFHQIVASIGWDLGWRKSQRQGVTANERESKP